MLFMLPYTGQGDWTSRGITMATSTVDMHAPTLEDFHGAFDVVFIDPTGYVNLSSTMAKSTFFRVSTCTINLYETFLDSIIFEKIMHGSCIFCFLNVRMGHDTSYQ